MEPLPLHQEEHEIDHKEQTVLERSPFHSMDNRNLKWVIGILSIIILIFSIIQLITQNKLLQKLDVQNASLLQLTKLTDSNIKSVNMPLVRDVINLAQSEIEKQKAEFSEDADNQLFGLSNMLIKRIAYLSHSIKAYVFLDEDTLIKSPLSPERGILLIALNSMPLDTTTLDQIYSTSNFLYADLRGADLSGKRIKGALLGNADLSYANLNGAKLWRTHLGNANLTAADLSFANFYYVNMPHANLTKANLTEAKFTHVALGESNLSKARFYGSKFYGVDMFYSDLRDAEFKDAEMKNVNFTEAIFNNPY